MTDFHSRRKEDMSGTVVFSFEDRWKMPILGNEIKVFFRKRVPTSFVPRQVFFYISAPTSSIVGFARIISIARVTKTKAIEHRLVGGISESELTRYMSGRDEIYMISLADQHIFERQVSLAKLLSLGVFHPPQNFFFLSKWGVATVKELGGVSIATH